MTFWICKVHSSRAIWSRYMSSRPLKCCSLYKFNCQNRFWKIFEIFSWGILANWGAKTETLLEISLNSLLLWPLIIDAVRNRLELIMACQTSPSNLALVKSNLVFPTARTWSSSKWLRKSGGFSKIMPRG